MSTTTDGPIPLSAEQLESFGEELDAIRQRVIADRGERDANYIRKVIRAQRGLEVAGRGLLCAGFFPPAWVAGTAALGAVQDPRQHGDRPQRDARPVRLDRATRRYSAATFEWDNVCPADQWRHSHNYMHHTHTNIVGKDRDLGYGVLRMSEEQGWTRSTSATRSMRLLTLLFEYGRGGARPRSRAASAAAKVARREARLCDKSGARCATRRSRTTCCSRCCPVRIAPLALAGNLTANMIRNVWSFTIIFCGHFPEGVEEFDRGGDRRGTRGQWYYRQMLGSANLTRQRCSTS